MKKYLFIIVSLLMVSTSCKKFLDVQPESDVSKEELFSTQDGFMEALNGVYTYCGSTDMYGGNLTFSNLDIIAQNYQFSDVTNQKIASFQYSDPAWVGKYNAIWTNVYKAIGNCNAILEIIDQKKALFTAKNYEIIKGETLNLRAYLHFDLLRMYAPSFKNNPTAKAIPYVTTVSTKSTPFSTVTETLDKVIADLNAAKALLKTADPITTASYVVGYPTDTKATELSSPVLFTQNRRHRMNYYASCAELARVYLYKSDYVNSLANAQEVIDAQKFPWTLQTDFFNSDATKRDKVFYNELVFAWYVPKSEEQLIGLFSKDNPDYSAVSSQIDAIYETGSVGAEDWRPKQWFRTVKASGVPDRSYLVKYTVNPTPQVNLHPLVAPALRLTEMYYIAAEASFSTNPGKAVDYFNTVRTHRGIGTALPASISQSDFMTELVKECRKEWYGESQIFFMNKRLNRNIVTTEGLIYPASNQIFVFPLPIDEQAYRN
jgi:hypothetical protein